MKKITSSYVWGSSLLAASLLNADNGTNNHSQTIHPIEPAIITAQPFARPSNELSQPWIVLHDAALDNIRTASLGETLNWQPGISSTHFTAGASRPVIRGQEGQRVSILANGLGSQDLSNTSGDHAVSIDPLLVEQVEILRGPANLLYGGNAIGGVVNVVDGRIPRSNPGKITGAFVSEYQSVSDGKYAGFKADIPAEQLVIHVDGIIRKTDDYDTPDFTPVAGGAKTSKVDNSDTELKTGAIGLSYVDKRGYFGGSFSKLDSEYGVLTEGGKAPFIKLEQNRFVLEGQRKLDAEYIDSISGSYAYADYEHSEFEAPGVLGTGFELNAHETRWELKHTPTAGLQGVLGFQYNLDEVHTPTAESIFKGNNVNRVNNNRKALFILEEMPLREDLRWEVGARVEWSDYDVSGAAPTVRNRNFTALSGSTGLTLNLSKEYSLSGNFAYAERAPAAEELYSNGVHEATESYTIGRDSLNKEESLGFDVTLRRNQGSVTGELTFFANQFDNFIFQQATGRQVNEDGVNPVPAGDEPFTERRYTGVEALFYGFEASAETMLWEQGSQSLTLRGIADYTRAKNESTNDDLPRIAPMRAGGELAYAHAEFSAMLQVRHAFKQDAVPTGENTTPSYTLVNLRSTYILPVERNQLEVFAGIDNITNELAYISSSFRKEKAPMPGRSFNLGFKYLF